MSLGLLASTRVQRKRPLDDVTSRVRCRRSCLRNVQRFQFLNSAIALLDSDLYNDSGSEDEKQHVLHFENLTVQDLENSSSTEGISAHGSSVPNGCLCSCRSIGGC